MFQYFVKIVPTTYHKARPHTQTRLLNRRKCRSLAKSLPQTSTQSPIISEGSTQQLGEGFRVTRILTPYRPSAELAASGVFVFYDLSPIMCTYTESRQSFATFLTSVCAIVGGVFTVAGIVDKFVYHGTEVMRKKFEMGKLG